MYTNTKQISGFSRMPFYNMLINNIDKNIQNPPPYPKETKLQSKENNPK